MRQDPGFNVNMVLDKYGNTLLHYACDFSDDSSPAIPFLLAHPDIDVNVKKKDGSTSFCCACAGGYTSCVREMLQDSRVKVNEPDNDGWTPLYGAARWGHLGIIRWWIASGREIDLGTPGDDAKTDAIGVAKRDWRTDMWRLLESFQDYPEETRHQVRVDLGWYDDAAAEMFALVVFVSDGLLQIKDTTTPSPAARFFSIARRLPLELQMVLCHLVMGSAKEIIPGKESEVAFKVLARRLW